MEMSVIFGSEAKKGYMLRLFGNKNQPPLVSGEFEGNSAGFCESVERQVIYTGRCFNPKRLFDA